MNKNFKSGLKGLLKPHNLSKNQLCMFYLGKACRWLIFGVCACLMAISFAMLLRSCMLSCANLTAEAWSGGQVANDTTLFVYECPLMYGYKNTFFFSADLYCEVMATNTGLIVSFTDSVEDLEKPMYDVKLFNAEGGSPIIYQDKQGFYNIDGIILTGKNNSNYRLKCNSMRITRDYTANYYGFVVPSVIGYGYGAEQNLGATQYSASPTVYLDVQGTAYMSTSKYSYHIEFYFTQFSTDGGQSYITVDPLDISTTYTPSASLFQQGGNIFSSIGYSEADYKNYGIEQYNKGYQAGLTVNSDGFDDLMFAVIDAPINALKGLFNFEFLGVNVALAFSTIFTILVSIAIVKVVL